MMERNSLEPRVCRRVSSSKCSQCSLSDVSRVQCSSTGSSSWRTTFRAGSLASARAKESVVEFSTSTRDTRSSASHSARTARSSGPLIRRFALSRDIVASRAEDFVASMATARATSIVVTSAYRVVKSALP
jgi:hypothetical protein